MFQVSIWTHHFLSFKMSTPYLTLYTMNVNGPIALWYNSRNSLDVIRLLGISLDIRGRSSSINPNPMKNVCVNARNVLLSRLYRWLQTMNVFWYLRTSANRSLTNCLALSVVSNGNWATSSKQQTLGIISILTILCLLVIVLIIGPKLIGWNLFNKEFLSFKLGLIDGSLRTSTVIVLGWNPFANDINVRPMNITGSTSRFSLRFLAYCLVMNSDE